MILYFLALLALLFCSAFFSATEMCFSSANRMRLENMKEEGSRRAKLACSIIDHYDRTLSVILVGNNLANIGASSLTSVITLVLFRTDEWTWLATALLSVLVIVFCETIPKILGKQTANSLSLRTAFPIMALTVIFYPIVLLVVGGVKLVTLPFRGESRDGDPEDAASQELQSIIETAEDEDVLDEERSELLQAALEFSDVSASEAMTARVDMTAIDIDDDWDEILATVEATPFSRLPVYEDSIDNVIGFLYLNRFFKAMMDKTPVDIRAMLIPPCFVYKTMKLPNVLAELRRQKKHLAVVTDEYGGTLGVITMEDVLEEIVGEIWDETDEVEPEIVKRENGVYELDGDMVISDFLELTGWKEELLDTDSATVGGWTIERFGVFPKAGDSFRFENLTVTVLAMDGHRVERVLAEFAAGDGE